MTHSTSSNTHSKPSVVVFAYHNIGCIGVEKLLAAGFHIKAIFTHLDDPNENQFYASVADLAAQHDLPIFTAQSINHPLWIERIKSFAPDYIFSFYYRNILGEELLSVAKSGAFNLHGSLLPKYRGCAPVNWALVKGETETGVTLHKMVQRCDAGDIISQQKVAITDEDNALTLHSKIAEAAASLLANTLPTIVNGSYVATAQDESQATYFGKRNAKDGKIDWTQPAQTIHNLVRAVTKPYPGAFTFLQGKRLLIWQSKVVKLNVKEFIANRSQEHTLDLTTLPSGTVINTHPLQILCKQPATQNEIDVEIEVLEIITGQIEGGVLLNGHRLASSLCLVPNAKLGEHNTSLLKARKKVLILGVNGFIGNHLTERLLESPDYEVYGMDISHDAIKRFISHPRFHFVEGDMTIHTEWIAYHIKKCDVILPLVAIATPIQYTRNPLRVFELDFEENLKIIRYCVKYNKRVIFPSTSEVYGMCDDPFFDEQTSKLVVGPIHKQRWIYSTSKQLLDRIIWAYGKSQNLPFTLFRPFNWMGPRLDSLDAARVGSSRVITQLILNLVEGTPIKLIDGGEQKRCFTDIQDGIEALFRIVEDKDNNCNQQIINIGNPDNEASIKTLASTLLERFNAHPLRDQFPPFAGFQAIESLDYYGEGYEDVAHRKPNIQNAKRLLDWSPSISLEQTIDATLDYFLQTAFAQTVKDPNPS